MTVTFLYAPAPAGAIHLIPEARAFTLAPRTVCGLPIRTTWPAYGDETQSGIAATCQTCRRVARRMAEVER